MNHQEIVKCFPARKHMTYLDSSALALKPQEAIDAMNHYFTNISVSTRTRDTKLGVHVIDVIAETRQLVADLVDAKFNEVIFTSGTTESLNMFVYMIEPLVKAGDEILLDVLNHSSNMVSWVELAKRKNCKIVFSHDVTQSITAKTKIIAMAQKPNTFIKHYDMNKLYKQCKKQGIILVNDAAQAIVNEKVSLTNCDMIAFSANKLYGPTGLGCLIVKEDLLVKLEPVKMGGGIFSRIQKDGGPVFKTDVARWEAGTPNVAGIFMFNASLKFFNKIGYKQTNEILEELALYAYEKLSKVKNIEIYSQPKDCIIMFNIKKVFCEDVALYLGKHNVYVRSGFFCAQYLQHVKTEPGFVRVSLGIYNTKADIDHLVDVLSKAKSYINV
ncbi:Probable cysteine desulfurase [Mycoplasmopsis californica]|uniref:Aminotransferase class V-fold PLP-dependent enzyme n=1 Tax=Mycoplasmopsis equigenitalium TaxID=114883 RepID=A0ABY5J500_9BACT|nr:aminotransferase class V-fold PLP-dependent enzyme [Mycoplasmopsis equigenitalium]UUD37045.1 aminotransferase class V-fold PLP-dependent enzyme [Mycoplasmopsis equigenitalium]VEU69655.1 Probable cysteine desulfurase [Mycoplasmopsis californica]